jgi:hypothetical protein
MILLMNGALSLGAFERSWVTMPTVNYDSQLMLLPVSGYSPGHG